MWFKAITVRATDLLASGEVFMEGPSDTPEEFFEVVCVTLGKNPTSTVSFTKFGDGWLVTHDGSGGKLMRIEPSTMESRMARATLAA
jgi:hypothetical protein